MSNHEHDAAGYWKANIRLILICLVIWVAASYGFVWFRNYFAPDALRHSIWGNRFRVLGCATRLHIGLYCLNLWLFMAHE